MQWLCINLLTPSLAFYPPIWRSLYLWKINMSWKEFMDTYFPFLKFHRWQSFAAFCVTMRQLPKLLPLPLCYIASLAFDLILTLPHEEMHIYMVIINLRICVHWKCGETSFFVFFCLDPKLKKNPSVGMTHALSLHQPHSCLLKPALEFLELQK